MNAEPLTAEEEADLRDWVANVDPKGTPTEMARLLATLDAARSASPVDDETMVAIRARDEADWNAGHPFEQALHDRRWLVRKVDAMARSASPVDRAATQAPETEGSDG